RERLLAIHVLLQLHRHDAGRSMRVVRGADRDGVDLLAHLVEHLAEVEKLSRAEKALLASFLMLLVRRGVEVVFVDIAKSDDVTEFPGRVDTAVPFTADTDTGEAQFAVRPVGGPRGGDRRGGVEIPGRGRSLKKTTAVHA